MEDKDTEGTVLSRLKPIVTMLTDTLVKDFCPAYKPAGKPYGPGTWIRTAEDGTEHLVTDDQLKADVEAWLLDLEHRMENESDKAYAKIVTRMIRQNKGWVILLTNRVKRRLAQ